jgi:hypothetical protein
VAAEEAAPAAAPDFSGIRLRVGDVVYVTDLETGVEVKGPIRSLSPGLLAIDGYRFEAGRSLKIERPGDPIWDGAAIGFGVGALFGVSIGSEACLHAPKWQCAVSGGVSYAALGALIDWAHKGRRFVYATDSTAASLHLVPRVSPREKSLALAWSFN